MNLYIRPGLFLLITWCGFVLNAAAMDDVPTMTVDTFLSDHVVDEHLKKCIREQTKASTLITTITDLVCQDGHIITTEGLGLLSGLQELTLSNNETLSNIDDLSLLVNLTRLSVGNSLISDISGLANLTNLTDLGFSYSRVVDIRPIANLTNLTRLSLVSNRISDISPLANLSKLTNLRLVHNYIPDISVINNLPNLDTLRLSYVADASIASLHNLSKLQTLALNDIKGFALSAVTQFSTLKSLYVSGPRIVEVEVLSEMPNLAHLTLTRSQISDISSLSDLTGLSRLDLNGNLISDISMLAGLTNLTTLDLSDNPISDISALASMTKLLYLYINNGLISNIDVLAGLKNLSSIYLRENQITDISALAGLKNLNSVDLGFNQITDISVLSQTAKDILGLHFQGNPVLACVEYAKSKEVLHYGLPASCWKPMNVAKLLASNMTDENLKYCIKTQFSSYTLVKNITSLSCNAHQIASIKGLSLLTNLQFLSLHSNNIVDISELSKLVSLTELRLGGNNIRDIRALSGLTGLTRLYLDNNQISNISVLSNLNNLISQGLTNNPIENIARLDSLYKTADIFINTKPENPCFIEALSESVFHGSPESCLLKRDYLTVGDVVANYLVDDNLKTCVNQRYPPKHAINEVNDLSCNNTLINDITGLEYFTELKKLSLNNTGLKKMGPLAQLVKLEELNLADNELNNISILLSLESLTHLNLSGNSLSSIYELESLSKLRSLSINLNQDLELSPIDTLVKLETIDISANVKRDLGVLTNLPLLNRLRFFDTHNIDFDLSIFAVTPQLTSLKTCDIDDAVKINSLTALDLSWCRLRNIAPLSQLSNLAELNLMGNFISDLSPLKFIYKDIDFSWDSLHGNPVAYCGTDQNAKGDRYAGLPESCWQSPYPSMTVSSLVKNIVTDEKLKKCISEQFADMETVDNIKTLDCTNYHIQNLTGIDALYRLENLNMSHNKISHLQYQYLGSDVPVSVFFNLMDLKILNLSNNQITDIHALASLSSLTQLDLGHNQILDISPLSSLTELSSFKFIDNVPRLPCLDSVVLNDNNTGLAYAQIPNVCLDSQVKP